MALSAEQRDRRRSYVGASDVPKILGVVPESWGTANDVWVRLTHPIQDDDLDSEAVELGRDFELPLVRWAAREELGPEFEPLLTLEPEHVDEELHLCSHPDAVFKRGRETEGVEAKFTGIPFGTDDPETVDDYGEPGTDQVPESVIVQANSQMLAGGYEVTHVPILTASYGRPTRRLYRVERDTELVRLIRSELLSFWKCVETGQPPANRPPSLSVMKRAEREADLEVPVDPALVEDWLDKKAAAKEAKALRDEAQAALLEAMGEWRDGRWVGAEFGDFGDPVHVISYLQQTKRGIDRKALKLDYPAIHDHYYKEGKPFRVCRKKKRQGDRP